MKKLLITGFEPFGGGTTNPSWDALALIGDTVGEFEIHKLRVPVEFTRGAELIIAEAERVGADVVLCIGLAAGRKAVMPEMVGINLRYGSADNAGYKPCDEPIVDGGCAAYFTTLPVRKMAEAVKAKGISAGVSYSAGTYVCNDVLYSILHRFDGTEVRAGFIHVPALSDAMTLGDIAAAIEAAVNCIE